MYVRIGIIAALRPLVAVLKKKAFPGLEHTHFTRTASR